MKTFQYNLSELKATVRQLKKHRRRFFQKTEEEIEKYILDLMRDFSDPEIRRNSPFIGWGGVIIIYMDDVSLVKFALDPILMEGTSYDD